MNDFVTDKAPQQLPLGLGLAPANTLEGFEPGGNDVALRWLARFSEGDGEHGRVDRRGWLWGSAGSGRSHLLQAACHRVRALPEGTAVLLDAEILRESSGTILEGLASQTLVAIDDVDAVAAEGPVEAALFQLCNEMAQTGGRLLFGASAAPLSCDWRLPDLRSRLSAATVFRLQGLDDAGRLRALRRRARIRGLQLEEATARYILERFSRDAAALFALLDDLDVASLSEQRRLTKPFVRDLIDRRGKTSGREP